MTRLKEALKDWTDIDGCAHELARVLGLVEADSEMSCHKALYWSDSPTSKMLFATLESMRAIGVLEYREGDTDYQYRWNPDYKLDY